MRFASESVKFCRWKDNSFEAKYYKDQFIRSSGSSALNFGEAQGTNSVRDFIHKNAISRKELKECRTTLKILDYLDLGDHSSRQWLLSEVEELIAISSKMINNKKK